MADIKSLFELFFAGQPCPPTVSRFVSNGNTSEFTYSCTFLHGHSTGDKVTSEVYSWDQNAACTPQGQLSYHNTSVSPRGNT